MGEIFINANSASYNMPALWGYSLMPIIPSYNMPAMWGYSSMAIIPSYNMPVMWGYSSMAIIPSYNMPVMWGGYLSMAIMPPIICLLCGGEIGGNHSLL